jgi:hypothetical protein
MRMSAEIIFLDPDDMSSAVPKLVDQGFDVEVLDWADDYSPARWIMAAITTELGEHAFLDEMDRLNSAVWRRCGRSRV